MRRAVKSRSLAPFYAATAATGPPAHVKPGADTVLEEHPVRRQSSWQRNVQASSLGGAVLDNHALLHATPWSQKAGELYL